jgi:hypothetical protein
MSVSKAYMEGYSAGLADNYQDYHNPYPPESEDHKEWSRGYSNGLADWDMEMDDGG